jgi:PAS domain S-box-containing protein
MNFDNLVRQMHGVRAQGDRFWREAERSGDPEVLLPAALEELGTALEELRVVEEEVRAQNSELLGANDRLREHRDRYRLLFDQAPVAYLVTDPFGVVTEANRRAAGLLGTVQRFLVGRPLTMFVPGDGRARFRQRLRELGRDGAAAWELRLQPRRGGPSPVAVTVEAFPGPGDAAAELRWALREVQPATLAPPPGKVSVPDWDSLAEALHEIIGAAIPLLRADGVGLMLADQQGALRWVTATNQAEQAFEQAERDLGEGPCIDAFTAGRVVSTSDLRADPRWPRLGPAARTNQIRGVLSAPVVLDDQPIGTCNALTNLARTWTEADAGAVRAFAVMLGRLIGSITDARHKTELTAQLQFALTSRVLVEQAKGVLMEREGVDARRAFELLRHRARSSERKLADVAREVVARRR